jgi:hypothetical protein
MTIKEPFTIIKSYIKQKPIGYYNNKKTPQKGVSNIVIIYNTAKN